MRLREFAPSHGSNEPNGDFPMSWDQIVDRFRQVLTHHLGWRLEAGFGRTASFSKGPMLFVINQYTSPRQIQYYINDGQRQWKGFKFTQWSSITQLLDTVRSLPLNEFAPTSHRDGGEGGGGDEEERQVGPYAQRWFENPNDHPKIRSILKSQGYTVLARGWTHTEIAIQNDKTGRKMIFFDPDAIDPYE